MRVDEDSLGSWFKPTKNFTCTDCTQDKQAGSKAYYIEENRDSGNFKLLCQNCMQKRQTAKEL